MRKLFIADDEASIREGIKLLIDWEELGYEVCGEAATGTEALSSILALKPDVALLDIRMPGLTGLEVIEQVKQAGLHCNFIILSGYSDFKYAQSAVKLGVIRYLTKPVDEDELTELIKEINELIDKQENAKSKEAFLAEKSQKEILQNIISDKIDISRLDPEALNMKADTYQLVAYENFKTEESELPYQFSELFGAVASRDSVKRQLFVHFEFRHKNFLLLLGTNALTRFRRFLEHYDKTVEKGSPLDSLFIAYSKPFENLRDLKNSYTQTEALLKRRFFCTSGQHVLGYDEFSEEIETASSASNLIDSEKITYYSKQLSNFLQTFNRRRVAETLYELEKYFYTINLSNEKIKLFMIDMYLQIRDTIVSQFSSTSSMFYTNSGIIAAVNSCNYLYEVVTLFSKQFEDIMNELGNSSRDSVMDDILYYIEHNYHTNIKLETIASLFGYNSSYLGKVFTKTVGENFNSYIDKVRIKYATELLKDSSLKVYEISEKVGYRNVDYFHKKFKKITGESPVEYKKRFE